MASITSIINTLWTEKYRPQILSDYISHKEVIEYFENARKNQFIQNILLTGKPGCGKTTLALIIVNDILQCQYLYINASDENGIEEVRTKISQFVMTKSIDGRLKVVVLDEADGLSTQAQRALRNLMEEYSETARFILTGNERHKIIPALQSRCESFDLNYTLQDVAKRCDYILEKENILLNTTEKKKEFIEIIKDCCGDIRKTINKLQTCCISGEFKISEDKNSNINSIIISVIDFLINKQPLELRKYTIEHEGDFNNDYISLMKTLMNNIFTNTTIDQKTKINWLTILGEFIYRSSFVVDQEINWFTCCLNLIK